MRFRVKTADFRRAVRAIQPFIASYGRDVARDIALEVTGDRGSLSAELGGHQMLSPFPVDPSCDSPAVTVALPFRVASGIAMIEDVFRSKGPGTWAEMQIERENERFVFRSEARGATCEVPVCGAREGGLLKAVSDAKQAGVIESCSLIRVLSLANKVLAVPKLDDARSVVSFVQSDGGRRLAVAGTDSELLLVEDQKLVGGLCVHVASIGHVIAFARRAGGALTVRMMGARAFLTDAEGNVLGIPRPRSVATFLVPPATESDVVVRAKAIDFHRALAVLQNGYRLHAIRAALSAAEHVLSFEARDGEHDAIKVTVPVVFVTSKRDLRFRVRPSALTRLFEGHKATEVELRLTIGGQRPGCEGRLLSASETVSDGDGPIVIQRIATLMT